MKLKIKGIYRSIIGFLAMCCGFAIVAYSLWIAVMIPTRLYYGAIIGVIGTVLILFPGMILCFMGLSEMKKQNEEKNKDKLKYGLG